MIRTRAAASGGAALLGLVVLLGQRGPDPSAMAAADRLVRERATAATAALDDLRAAVTPGLEAARGAAAAVLSADEPPGDELTEAARIIAGAEAAVAPARRAVTSLAGSRAAQRPDAAPLPAAPPAGELRSIAGQLRATVPAADLFVDLRTRGTALPAVLEGALNALERGDLDRATTLTAQARADHGAVAAWKAGPSTLPVWLQTTDAMISAVEEIIAATSRGDPAAAAAAGGAFSALGDDAGTADRALRIALSEGGAALTAAPLERLAGVVAAIEESRAAAAALSDTGP